MNEFENKLIKESPYERGLFTTIPNYNKRGSAFILSGGSGNDILVNEHTTTKEIRQGRYTKLIEISILPYIKEIRFCSPGKENAYSFDVYVKAVIQVFDPIVFYQNKNIDVDAYFDNLFSLDVRKITKRYSILDYEGMDEELTQKLSSYNTIDKSIGFRYQISVVDATPGEKAQEYVSQFSKQQLEAGLKNNARRLAKSYSLIYEEAIQTEVAEGKISEAEAILKIQEYKNMNFDNQRKHLEELRESGLITDKQAKDLIAPALNGIGVAKQTESVTQNDNVKKNRMGEFFLGDE